MNRVRDMRLDAARTAAEKHVTAEIRAPRESNRPSLLKSDGDDQSTATGPTIARKRGRLGWSLFAVIVVIPCLLIGIYYTLVASDQYESEMRFAVRGTTSTPLDMLGLSALPGTTSQTPDAYIVVDYIKSPQLLNDIREQLGIDVRVFFAREDIDPLYRIDANMPLAEFIDYWNWMTNADFNSNTAIATFTVRAFRAEDAAAITSAVLEASSKLVNDLGTEARIQLIASARAEVERTEGRLTQARQMVRQFRNREQALDPQQQAQTGQQLLIDLERELVDLNTRRAALLATVSVESPSLRIIDRQINALEDQIQQQLERFGSGGERNSVRVRNLSDVVNEYNELMVEQEFAEKAYTSALSFAGNVASGSAPRGTLFRHCRRADIAGSGALSATDTQHVSGLCIPVHRLAAGLSAHAGRPGPPPVSTVVSSSSGFSNQLGVMGRVVTGLILRETKTRFGKHRLGYVWALIEPAVFILSFVVLRAFMQDRIPFGESILLFVIPALLVIRIFIGISGRMMAAFSANKALLAYPPVKPPDVLFARFLLEMLTMSVLIALFFTLMAWIAEIEVILFYDRFAAAIAVLFLVSAGMGVFNAVFSILWPAWERIWGFSSFPILLLSGAFFLPESLPPAYQYWLSFNPVLHCVEWMRTATYLTYDPLLDKTYPIGFGLVALVVGLALERIYRYKLLSA